MNKPANQNSFDVKDIVGIIKLRKWFLIIPILLTTVIAYGGSFWLVPEFQASTIIWIDKPASASRELMSIIGSERFVRESNDDRRRKLQALQNEITSQNYLFQLIRNMKLDNDADLTEDATKLREKNPGFTVEQLKYNILLGNLRDQIKVSYVGKDQIELTVKSTSPSLARDIATKLTEIMESEKTKYELEKILDNQNFADLQLTKREFYYQQAIDSLTEAKSRMTNISLSNEISSETNRQEITSEIKQAKDDITYYNNLMISIKTQLKQDDLDKVRLKYSDSLISLRASIEGQLVTYVELMEKYEWTEQNVINVNIGIIDNIRVLVSGIQNQVENQHSSLEINQQRRLKDYFVAKENYDISKSRQKHLANAFDDLVERINSIPRMEAEISDLESRVEEARRYRDAFKSEETTVEILSEQAKGRTKYKVIEAARTPLEPFWPDKNKIAILGLILGFVIGGIAVLLGEVLDSTFKRTEDVENLLGLPVIAVIPKIDKLKFR